MSMSTAFDVPFSEGATYKDLSGFTWIMNFGTYIMPLVVRGDFPWKTINEFIEWAERIHKGSEEPLADLLGGNITAFGCENREKRRWFLV